VADFEMNLNSVAAETSNAWKTGAGMWAKNLFP
jgi:hypothetical protein